MSARKDLTGMKFGRLEVIEFWGHTKLKMAMWLCVCDCGNLTTSTGANLRFGKSQSCDCIRLEAISTHGLTGTPQFQAAADARDRCLSNKNPAYHSYGGRGIEFRFTGIGEMAVYITENLGERPEGHSIDRIDNNGHYEPGNLRWATAVEQRNNQRTRRDQISGRFLPIAAALCLMLTSCASVQSPAPERHKRLKRVTFFTRFEDRFGAHTASGIRAQEGTTVAAPSSIPMGTEIEIPYLAGKIGDGKFTVQDRGSIPEKKDRIDVYVECKNRRDARRRMRELSGLPPFMDVVL